ncbi:hypothetical protein ACA910_019017 [Epithemia clementina (nom. ined.)]
MSVESNNNNTNFAATTAGGYYSAANNNNNMIVTGDAMQNEQQVVRSAGRQAICQFLQGQNCFACLRRSGKVVVFDTRIPIQLAFYALVEHDMQAAPLWDPVQCKFAGILTVTDFIDILRYFRSSMGNKSVADLAIHSIAEILQDAQAAGAVSHRPFWAAESTCSLQRACLQLLATRQDYLPILYTQDMRVLACLTYTHILEHLVTHFREQRRLFDDSITDLGIGTYGAQLVTATPQQTLAQALELMAQHGLSALPVVEESSDSDSGGPVILGAYSRSDITFLTKAKDAEDAMRNLDLTLADVLAQTRQDVTTPDALRTCSPNHTLQAIFESFAQVRFHRLYVVAEDEEDDGGGGDSPMESSSTPPPPEEYNSRMDTATSVTDAYSLPPQSPRQHGGGSSSNSSGQQRVTSSSSRRGRPRLLGVVSAKDLVAYFLQDAAVAEQSSSSPTTFYS